MIYLEHYENISRSVENRRYKKTLHLDKIGRESLLTYNESSRLLALCGSHDAS